MTQGTTDTPTPPGALSPQQEAYALARAAGKNGKEAAELAGVAERVTECMEPGRGGATGELNLKAALATLRFVGAEPATRQELRVEDATLTDDERAARLAALLDGARARRVGPPAG